MPQPAPLHRYDANGNVGQMVDETGTNIVAAHEYATDNSTVRASRVEAQENPFRFSTKYLDEDPELYYYGQRYYSPEVGRWVSRDHVGEHGGANLYHGCFNNPVNRFDWLGLESGSAAGTHHETTQLGNWAFNWKAFFTYECDGTSVSLDSVTADGFPRFTILILGYEISVVTSSLDGKSWDGDTRCWTVDWSAIAQLDVNIIDLGFIKGITYRYTGRFENTTVLCCQCEEAEE